MRHKRWLVGSLVLALVSVWSLDSWAQMHGGRSREGSAGQEMMGSGGGMMGQGGMGGMMGSSHGEMMGPEGAERMLGPESPWISIILRLRNELQLTKDQIASLEKLRLEFERQATRLQADLRIAELDLRQILSQESVNLAQAKTKMEEEARVDANLRYGRLEAITRGRALLTAEQKEKLQSLIARSSQGPGGRGPEGAPRKGSGGMMGPGGGGMMGPGSMLEPGDGAISNAVEIRKVAAATPSLAQVDERNSVTVEVTPVAPLGQGKIKFKVSLNTHSVSLDGYKIETLATLKSGGGEELKALAWESGEGSGHHRSGVLIFPDKDSKGKSILNSANKSLELQIKNVGGNSNRVFRWDLPLPKSS